jgi:hypothetical protein
MFGARMSPSTGCGHGPRQERQLLTLSLSSPNKSAPCRGRLSEGCPLSLAAPIEDWRVMGHLASMAAVPRAAGREATNIAASLTIKPHKGRVQWLASNLACMRIACGSLHRVGALFSGTAGTFVCRAGCSYVNCELRAVHSLLIQPPTAAITAITATSRIPSSTVYSSRAAPSSSLARRLINAMAYLPSPSEDASTAVDTSTAAMPGAAGRGSPKCRRPALGGSFGFHLGWRGPGGQTCPHQHIGAC